MNPLMSIFILLAVLFVMNCLTIAICFKTWYGQKKSQQVKYWYDEEGKLQFDLDDRR